MKLTSCAHRNTTAACLWFYSKDNARLAAIGAAAVVFYFALTAVTEAANAFNEKDDMVLRCVSSCAC